MKEKYEVLDGNLMSNAKWITCKTARETGRIFRGKAWLEYELYDGTVGLTRNWRAKKPSTQ